VFGELYFLLEYRDQGVEVLYGGEPFTLPTNLYFVCTMNTADRSIALLDAAMRFAFVEMHPATQPTESMLRVWLARKELPPTSGVLLGLLNAAIEDRDAHIGPSYFMTPAQSKERLARIWRTDEHDLCAARIAAAVHVSIRHLYAVLARADISLGDWIRDHRLEGCRRDLIHASARRVTISAIARRWGFVDPTHFGRAFKQRYGLTPKQWRDKHVPGVARLDGTEQGRTRPDRQRRTVTRFRSPAGLGSADCLASRRPAARKCLASVDRWWVRSSACPATPLRKR
jgi:AraC-like DNA-binding protein